MKKIWPWLLLLLLLMVFCVWSKKDTIHITKPHVQTAITPAVHTQQYIEYEISQKNDDYTLNGNFKNIAQQELLTNRVQTAHKTLEIQNTSTNETLLGEPAVVLTNKILPHFMATYTDGKISYHNQKLKISGMAKDYEAQHEMQRLLNTSTLASQDNSTVAIVTKPIHYFISKTGSTLHAKGTFDNQEQIHMIKANLPESTTTEFNVVSHHTDKGSLPIVEKLLPVFMEKYTYGEISYINEVLTVTGTVESDADLDYIKQLLANSEATIINKTVVDNSKALAAEKARLAALEAQREAARLAEATRKAEMKAKIINLLKLENIEFNVNKSTLTSKGQATVNKLGTILKEYTSVNIEIAGHTDSDGSAEYNQKLSQSRVDTVKRKLIADTINASRLTAKGYGETQPLVPNNSKANKQRNRRVEINILGE